MEVQHEYTVYDFGGILGTVGGSFGLFMGYSFYECFMRSLQSLRGMCDRQRKVTMVEPIV